MRTQSATCWQDQASTVRWPIYFSPLFQGICHCFAGLGLETGLLAVSGVVVLEIGPGLETTDAL